MRLVSYTLFCICRKHVLRDRHRSRSERHVLYRFLSLRFASINTVTLIASAIRTIELGHRRPSRYELNSYMRFTQIIAIYTNNRVYFLREVTTIHNLLLFRRITIHSRMLFLSESEVLCIIERIICC